MEKLAKIGKYLLIAAAVLFLPSIVLLFKYSWLLYTCLGAIVLFVLGMSFTAQPFCGTGAFIVEIVLAIVAFIFYIISIFKPMGIYDKLYIWSLIEVGVLIVATMIFAIAMGEWGSAQGTKVDPSMNVTSYEDAQKRIDEIMDSTMNRPKHVSVTNRAILGGLIGGSTGAIIGAVSAMEENQKNAEERSKR